MAFFSFIWCQQGERGRDAPIKLAVVLVLLLSFVACAVYGAYAVKMRYPGLPWLAVGVGLMLWELWETHARHRLWGLVAAGVVLALQQDFWAAPQSLAFNHLLDAAKYPQELNIKPEMRVFGVLLALLFFLALGGLPRRATRQVRTG